MTRRDEIEEEIENFAAWRRKNFDCDELSAHDKYVFCLKEKFDKGAF